MPFPRIPQLAGIKRKFQEWFSENEPSLPAPGDVELQTESEAREDTIQSGSNADSEDEAPDSSFDDGQIFEIPSQADAEVEERRSGGMNAQPGSGKLKDESEDSSQPPNRYLIAQNLDPNITSEHLQNVFSSYDGFIEAFLILPVGVVRSRGYVKYATTEQTLHVMTVFSRDHPEWKGYLEYGGLIKNPVPIKRTALDKEPSDARVKALQDNFASQGKPIPRNFFATFLRMWDSLCHRNPSVSENLMRGRVLEHIFHAIDENILDIKELRPEFSKEQDLHPSKEDSISRKRNRRLYLAAICDLSENLVHLSNLGKGLPGPFRPLSSKLEKSSAWLRNFRNLIVHTCVTFLGPWAKYGVVARGMEKRFDELEKAYMGFKEAVLNEIRSSRE